MTGRQTYSLQGRNKERHNALMPYLAKTKYEASNKSTYLSWAKYFVEGNLKNKLITSTPF